MKKLHQRLNNELDPTDADVAMSIAMAALRTMEVCALVLFAARHGMHIGRDDSTELSVRIVTLGERLGLVDGHDSADVQAFWKQLELDAGLGEPSSGAPRQENRRHER